jgi:hypothetical protein
MLGTSEESALALIATCLKVSELEVIYMKRRSPISDHSINAPIRVGSEWIDLLVEGSDNQ